MNSVARALVILAQYEQQTRDEALLRHAQRVMRQFVVELYQEERDNQMFIDLGGES